MKQSESSEGHKKEDDWGTWGLHEFSASTEEEAALTECTVTRTAWVGKSAFVQYVRLYNNDLDYLLWNKLLLDDVSHLILFSPPYVDLSLVPKDRKIKSNNGQAELPEPLKRAVALTEQNRTLSPHFLFSFTYSLAGDKSESSILLRTLFICFLLSILV